MKRFLLLLILLVPLLSVAQKPKVYELKNPTPNRLYKYKVVDIFDERFDTTNIGYILSGLSQGNLREAKIEGGLSQAMTGFYTQMEDKEDQIDIVFHVLRLNVREELSGMSEKFVVSYDIDVVTNDGFHLCRFSGENERKSMDATASGNKALNETFHNLALSIQEADFQNLIPYSDFLEEKNSIYTGELSISNLTPGAYADLNSLYENAPLYTLDQIVINNDRPQDTFVYLEKTERKQLRKNGEKFKPLAVYDGDHFFLSKRYMGAYLASNFFLIENEGRFLYGWGSESSAVSIGVGGVLGAGIRRDTPYVYDTVIGQGYPLDKEKNYLSFLKRYNIERNTEFEKSDDFISGLIRELNDIDFNSITQDSP